VETASRPSRNVLYAADEILLVLQPLGAQQLGKAGKLGERNVAMFPPAGAAIGRLFAAVTFCGR